MPSASEQSLGVFLLSQLLSGVLSPAAMETVFMEFVTLPITAHLLTDCTVVLRERMIPVHLHNGAEAIDTCGTGGSGKKTINTSTLSALIVAAAGGKIAKHGNRSASGNCGCFDLLEKLNVRIDLTPAMAQNMFEELGIVFLFAPLHHPALKLVAPLRKHYGKKTIFNLFGPLCNPAGITKQLIGTGSTEHARLLADTLRCLGSFGSKVVMGKDGLDEVTITADTTIYSVGASGVSVSAFSPTELSLPLATEKEIEGGSPEENMRIFLELLQGYSDTAKKNLALLNAAHALMLASMAPSIQEAFLIAKDTVESGEAYALFQNYKALSLSL